MIMSSPLYNISAKDFQEAVNEITLILQGVTKNTVHLLPDDKQLVMRIILTLRDDIYDYYTAEIIISRYNRLKKLCNSGMLIAGVCFLFYYDQLGLFTVEMDNCVESQEVTKDEFFRRLELFPPNHMYIEFGTFMQGYTEMKKIIIVNNFGEFLNEIGWY